MSRPCHCVFRYDKSKTYHYAPKFLLVMVFMQTGFKSKMDQGRGLLDKRCPGDVEVKNWVSTNNRREEATLSVEVVIINPTGDCHSGLLRQDDVGAATSIYQLRKRRSTVILREVYHLLF